MKNRIKPFIGLLLIAMGILLIGLSPYIRLRFDLSEEKKFTLSASSIESLRQQDAPIRIKVFLVGDKLPAGFKRMEKALDELLLDLKSTSSQGIEIEKIDVYEAYPDESARQKIIFELDSLGIPPTNVVNNEDGKQVQQLVFPGVLIEKGDAQIGVLLLKGNKLSSPQEMLNQSVEGMEYEIMQGIASISQQDRKKIGFFLDYSHVPAIKQIDLISSLKKRYDLYPVDLSASPTLDGLDAICVIQPDRKFSEADQYKIDQFLVKGGKSRISIGRNTGGYGGKSRIGGDAHRFRFTKFTLPLWHTFKFRFSQRCTIERHDSAGGGEFWQQAIHRINALAGLSSASRKSHFCDYP